MTEKKLLDEWQLDFTVDFLLHQTQNSIFLQHSSTRLSSICTVTDQQQNLCLPENFENSIEIIGNWFNTQFYGVAV